MNLVPAVRFAGAFRPSAEIAEHRLDTVLPAEIDHAALALFARGLQQARLYFGADSLQFFAGAHQGVN